MKIIKSVIENEREGGKREKKQKERGREIKIQNLRNSFYSIKRNRERVKKKENRREREKIRQRQIKREREIEREREREREGERNEL